VPKVITYGGANLYPKQRAAIYDPARIVIIEAGTKCCKTIGCLAWLAEKALVEGRPERNYWWCAPVYGQAEIGWRRMKARLPKAYYQSNQSKLTITLANGVRQKRIAANKAKREGTKAADKMIAEVEKDQAHLK
jgi:hypothetical protein